MVLKKGSMLTDNENNRIKKASDTSQALFALAIL